MKVCSKCKVEKPLTEFYKNKSRKDGHRCACKSCSAKYRAKYNAKYYAENKEELAKYNAKYNAENKEELAKYRAKYNAKYYAENKEEKVKYGAKYRAENKEEIAKRHAKYRAENKEEIAGYDAKYRARRKAGQPNCVYQIKNLENNKVYIGETIRGELRWKRHLADLRRNRHPNKLLREDFDKYGEEVFEWSILKEFEDEDKDNLLLEEARSIQRFIIEGKELYNLALTIDQLKMLLENK